MKRWPVNQGADSDKKKKAHTQLNSFKREANHEQLIDLLMFELWDDV